MNKIMQNPLAYITFPFMLVFTAMESLEVERWPVWIGVTLLWVVAEWIAKDRMMLWWKWGAKIAGLILLYTAIYYLPYYIEI